MNLKLWLSGALASLLLAGFSFNANASTRVVTSIKPLELLVLAVADEKVEITNLVPSGSSPHTYSMKPSQRRALENADRVFWVGPQLESFLTRLLEGEELHRRTVALGPEEADDEEPDHEEAGHHGHDHDHGSTDPHVWLDPALALDMATRIKQSLAELPDADPAQLDKRFEEFREKLAVAESDIREKLQPLEGISLFTYHDAFSRYAEHYGLEVEGVLTLNPEVSPGARHMAEVREQLRNANNPCLLTEPQFQREWWRGITSGMDITLAEWDPLAGDITPSANGYIDFQHKIADSVLRCLQD
jgi:zinc transport system substrate-binding protein